MGDNPFIALTLKASASFEERPIFVNAHRIQCVSQCFVRMSENTQPMFEEHGSWVCFGTSEDGDIAVVESYGEVTGAIREALRTAEGNR